MPDPARTHIIDMLDSRYRAGNTDDPGYHARIYRIHKPLQDTLAGRVHHRDNNDGNNQSCNWIGDGEAQPGTYKTDKGGERGEAVDTRVLSIGDQWYAIDTPANSDFVLRERFVAYYTYQGGSHAEIQLRGDVAAGQFLDRFNCAGRSAGYNDQYYENASQVFRAIIAVGVALIGRSPGEDKGDPQCDGCECISCIMQRIGV